MMDLNKVIVIIATLLYSYACINMNNPKTVFTVPYVRTFRKDLIAKSMGCGYNVIYSGYQFPGAAKDTVRIYHQQSFYGLDFNQCRPKDVYGKIFGYDQDYSALRVNPPSVTDTIKRQFRMIRKIIIDWKQCQGDLREAGSLLEQFVQGLQANGMQVFVKVPASYLCKNVGDSPYILSLRKVKKIIVEMYGEDPSKYKNYYDIFSQERSSDEQSQSYPDQECPQFPSYSQLSKKFPQKTFYIEKTLQQEQPGFLGDQFQEILENAREIYQNQIFYDAFPPNLIHI